MLKGLKTGDICQIGPDGNLAAEVPCGTIRVEREVTFPSQWFEENPDKKPSIPINPIQGNGDVLQTVYGRLRTGDLQADIVTRFLYNEFLKQPAELTKDWVSFNREIGKKGEKITIAKIAHFEVAGNQLDLDVGNADITPQQVHDLIVVCTCMYRLCGITNADYRTGVATMMKNMISKAMLAEFNPESLFQNYDAWRSYTPYNKIIAVIDMFLNEFPNHVYSKARVGTIPSRFKDCSVLMALQQILSLLSLDFPNLAMWIWTRRCADQFMQVIREGNEIDNIRSYAMYFMELGLSDKSPYSATANPDLHFFLHALGTSFNYERSTRAIFVGSPEVANILVNVEAMAFVLSTFATVGAQFAHKRTGKQLAVQEDVDKETELPTSGNPAEWVAWITRRKGTLPVNVVKRAMGFWIRSDQHREKTIGKFLHTMATSYMSTVENQ